MSIYDTALKEAKKAIAEYGQTVTFSIDNGATDPVTGSITATSVESFLIKGVISGFKFSEQNEGILQNDKKVLIANEGNIPTTSHDVDIDGVVHNVVNVDPVVLQGNVVVYKCQVRA